VTPAYQDLLQALKQLPGLGYRSAERVAMHLLVEKPQALSQLTERLQSASESIQPCPICGNLSEGGPCSICADPQREQSKICIVERISDLIAIERSSAWKGTYHVLHGRLSPIHGVGPEHLNFSSLATRIEAGTIEEVVLALSNDIEGQATCHYIQEVLIQNKPIQVSRIGFGLPSGSGVTYADSSTVKSALEARSAYK